MLNAPKIGDRICICKAGVKSLGGHPVPFDKPGEVKNIWLDSESKPVASLLFRTQILYVRLDDNWHFA